jgi:hypothetical protein
MEIEIPSSFSQKGLLITFIFAFLINLNQINMKSKLLKATLTN